MTLRTGRILQQIIVFGIVQAMLMAHNSLVSLNVRLMMTGVALAAGLYICSRRLRDGNLLNSPLDFGWLPYVGLTGLTVLFAPSPRRSLELWLWLIAIQLPVAYGALYLFRRRWPERAIYRALLGAGAYFYLLTATISLSYLSQWLAARANGLPSPGFRLYGVMDHPNIFAMFIAIASPCIIGYLFNKMSRIERVACLLWLAGVVLALFATGSRTGLGATVIGVSAGIVLSLLAHPLQPVHRFRVWADAHRPQAAAGVALAALMGIAALGVALFLQFGRPRQDNGGGRLSFYQSALAMFAARPVAGYGPGGFVQDEIRTHSVPPFRSVMPHAHNMLLGTAAESGMLGLLGFLALILVGAGVCVQVWRKQPSQRPLIAGPIAGLVAFCAFGVLDSPINQLGPFFIATLLLSYVAAQLPAPDSPRRVRAAISIAAVWIVAAVCVLVLIPYSTVWNVMRPDQPAGQGRSPEESAAELDRVAVYDSSDPLVTLQSAYLWGNIAANANAPDSALQNAILRFERGSQLDHDLGIYPLNLSALYLQAGRITDAVAAAQRAADLSPEDSVAWLNLGLALDRAGKNDEAQAAYLRALQREPRWSAMGFWQGSPVRQRAFRQYAAAKDDSGRYYDLVTAGNKARSAAQKSAALDAYNQALKLAPSPVAEVYVQGLIALANDDPTTARARLTQVTTMDILVAEDQPAYIDAWLCLGDLAGAAGDRDTMVRDYTIAYTYITSRGLYGFGTKGDWGYAVVGYQRFGIISDYLPGVAMPDISPEQSPRFETLAQAVAASGSKSVAAEIYRNILRANPDDQGAKTALAQLTS